ncbi:class I SAM-dependent methyltransferase [Sulfobacillus thermosulfidooxidans]|uniref:class I SAM-dependent methyltransferase n=1 Tax=Sulfobacillus thermosulfidooxidans TaxID=28034 RepID=UPI0006843C89|nr:class I SAM-dependent methyltransferase [Sulfobacillus thermosulfidooxidans]
MRRDDHQRRLSQVHHPWFSRAYILTQSLLESIVHPWRAQQGQRALGKTLIIGAGTGLDIPTLSQNAHEVTLLEPDPTFCTFLKTHYPAFSCLNSPAEQIPLDDASIDTVISTLVLCSVQDLCQSLQEIWRILRQDGQFLFLEHVAHDAPWWHRVQNTLTPLWEKVGGGCQLNRPTLLALKQTGFVITDLSCPHQGILFPVVQGRAIKPRPVQSHQETHH